MPSAPALVEVLDSLKSRTPMASMTALSSKGSAYPWFMRMKCATCFCALSTEDLCALMYPSSLEGDHLPIRLQISGGTPAASAHVLMVALSECSVNCVPATPPPKLASSTSAS